MLKKYSILKTNISAVNIDLACNTIIKWIKENNKVYICVAPVSTVIDCYKDSEYADIINHADMVTPDGMPVVWLGKIKASNEISRTYGPDLMLALCNIGRKNNIKHYFYGGSVKTLEILESRLKEKFSGINICGKYSPPVKPCGFEEESDVLDEINNASSDILWIGLGSPKQDYWMYKHREKLNVPIMIGVGAAFDFISGVKKQAPKWMQNSGLEWLFRLCSEPKRLWKRYLIGNTRFIYLIIKDFFKKR